MSRISLVAALIAGLVVAVPSAAQTGSGKLALAADDGIYTVNPDGSALSLIKPTSTGCIPSPCRRPAVHTWSPDGSLIAFAEDFALKVMNADGAGVRTIAYPHDATSSLGREAWSPDSHKIAFASGSSILIANVGGGVSEVRSESSAVSAPAWSPDGSKLAYANAGRLLVVDASGGTPTVITSETGIGDPTWSPDGRSLAFTEPQAIGVVNSDGSGRRTVVRALTGPPAWSPDGTKLAFAKTVGFYQSYPFRDIFVVDVRTLEQARMTFDGLLGGQDGPPIWSPDGRRIAFSRGGLRPSTMNSDGTCVETLVRWPKAYELAWQPMPGSPALTTKRCLSLRVTAVSRQTKSGTTVVVTVSIANSGTELLRNVRLNRLTGTDLTVTSVRASRGACLLRAVYLCRFGALARGESVRLTLRADGRRVSAEGRDGGWLLTRVSGGADEALSQPSDASFPLSLLLPHCTTRTPGRGPIAGTEDKELICGRRGPDRINGGGGGDRIRAGAGSDFVYARNATADEISCGPGRDTVLADRIDVIGRDCERVTHR